MELIALLVVLGLAGLYLYERRTNAAKVAALVAAVKAEVMNLELTVKTNAHMQASAETVIHDVETFIVKFKAKL